MTSQHRIERLRVYPPTLEPDSVFLGVLAGLGASSRPAHPRTTRSAGLRMITATASVAVIAGATWAAGMQTGTETPHSLADRPALAETTSSPSHGDVGTPQPDVSISPGSPLSPGLPGTSLPRTGPATGPAARPRAHDPKGPDTARSKDAKKPKHAKKPKKSANPGKGRRAGERTERGAGFGYGPGPIDRGRGLGNKKG